MNVERFQRLDRRLRSEPESLQMATWESRCGTTRCIAGWAVYDEIGVPIFSSVQPPAETPGVSYRVCTPEFYALAELLGVDPYVEFVAAELLGLGLVDASDLFHATPQAAAEFVRLAAEGRIREAFEVEL